MVQYVKNINEELIKVLENSSYKSNTGLSIFDFIKIITEEINKLETYNFPPEDRYKFVVIRQNFRNMSEIGTLYNSSFPSYKRISLDLMEILDNFGSINSENVKRDFSFLHDNELKVIIERDYSELSSILLPDGAWKSVVIMAGSILEAILFDVLTNPRYNAQALASPKVPINNVGRVINNIDKWKLQNLIEVAEDISILPQKRVKSIDQVLRDYRNFVHPKREIKSQHACTEAEALMAKGGLDGVCNHLKSII
ncbi:hypothetical protein COI41_22220 [Bacillus toyonensis]|uniref:hypothetical protein n=1 Tax=Bacillus toyonensis TaxID=155322 RepID=UPI000BFBFFC1|nr:hypothetical protein [Bacillus toyonensis]PHF52261.1 hypothetical protein COI41_22220 [Bacillus toyonensis]